MTDRSANVVLDGAAASLPAGTTFTWRVRTWASPDAEEACASAWATGTFTTALFDGFAAEPIWLAAAAEPLAEAVTCDLSGTWKGNGNGGAGVPITIATVGSADADAAHNYKVSCKLWTNKMVDSGNGTLWLDHGGPGRIAYAAPFNSSSPPCSLIKFDNGDHWCKASICGPGDTPPPPHPSPPPHSDKAVSYAFFRHSEALRGDVASASVFVSANQDGTLFKLLSAYRLYINGKVVSVGPGRSDSANSAVNHTVYDSVDITAELKQAWAESGAAATVVFAAQCYHHDGGADAMFMLQAQVSYSDTQEVHTILSDSSWLGYDATKIYNPTGGMGGDVPGSSTDNQPAEYIDASLVLSGWQDPAFKPAAGWKPAAPRTWMSPPVAKETLPVGFTPGLVRLFSHSSHFFSDSSHFPHLFFSSQKPVEMIELAPGHWFVDFGTEIMAGMTVKVTGGKAGSKMIVTQVSTSAIWSLRVRC